MADDRIQTGTVEPIQVFVVDVAGSPLPGLTDLFVRVRRDSDGFYFDWSDSTFKSAGWTTLNKLLVEADAVNATGVYSVVGGFDTSAITNPVADDDYLVLPLQTPGVNAVLPSPARFREGEYVDNIDAAVSSRAVPGDAMALTVGERGTLVDAVWDEDIVAAHGASDTSGLLLRALGAAISQRANNPTLAALFNIPDTASTFLADAIDTELALNHGSGQWDATASTAAIATAVWGTALPGAFGAGSAGFILGTNLDDVVSGVAADVWMVDISGNTAKVTEAGGQLSFIRKILDNRQEGAPGNPGTLILWDDDTVTPLRSWTLLDAAGGAITAATGAPARRTQGV